MMFYWMIHSAQWTEILLQELKLYDWNRAPMFNIPTFLQKNDAQVWPISVVALPHKPSGLPKD